MVTYTTPQTVDDNDDDDDDDTDELRRVTFGHPDDPTATPTSTQWRVRA